MDLFQNPAINYFSDASSINFQVDDDDCEIRSNYFIVCFRGVGDVSFGCFKDDSTCGNNHYHRSHYHLLRGKEGRSVGR